jgi:modulator of FtsH protease HflK
MGWNDDPDKNNNPWNAKQQPPDLDEALKRLQASLKKFFGWSSSKSSKRPYKPNARRKRPAMPKNGGVIAGMLFGAVAFLWLLSGIFIVDPAEQAAILRFGKYINTVGAGPHWIPRFICSKIILNVDRVSDYSYSAHMLTKDENLVSVAVAVQYRIGDLQDYLFNVADVEESLQQATSSALRQVVGTTTLDQLITEGRDAWGNNVQDSLVKILSRYKTGIIIVNVSPQPARAPENVQEAFDDAIKAQEDEKRFKEQARAYAARVVPIAEGNAKRIYEEAKAYAAQVVLRAKGDTAEFLGLLPEYKRAPFVTAKRMYLDTMQQVLSNTSKIVVDNKSSNVLLLPLEQLLANKQLINPQNSTNTASKQNADSLVTESYTHKRSLERPGRTN